MSEMLENVDYLGSHSTLHSIVSLALGHVTIISPS